MAQINGDQRCAAEQCEDRSVERGLVLDRAVVCRGGNSPKGAGEIRARLQQRKLIRIQRHVISYVHVFSPWHWHFVSVTFGSVPPWRRMDSTKKPMALAQKTGLWTG